MKELVIRSAIFIAVIFSVFMLVMATFNQRELRHMGIAHCPSVFTGTIDRCALNAGN